MKKLHLNPSVSVGFIVVLMLSYKPLFALEGAANVAQNAKGHFASTGALAWEPRPGRNPRRYRIGSPCGAVLLCSNTIVTAYHCLFDTRVGPLYFTLNVGPNTYANVGAASRAKNQNLVRRVDMNSVDFQDYALIGAPSVGLAMTKLQRPYDLQAAPVNARGFFPTLVAGNYKFKNNEVGSVAGYGANAPYVSGKPAAGAGRMRSGTVNFHSSMQLFPLSTFVPGNTNGCESDGGGPLFIGKNNLLAGILSLISDRPSRLGKGCVGGRRMTSIYVRIAAHRAWMDANLKAWCPERQRGGGNGATGLRYENENFVVEELNENEF